jgi:hypothetical protein
MKVISRLEYHQHHTLTLLQTWEFLELTSQAVPFVHLKKSTVETVNAFFEVVSVMEEPNVETDLMNSRAVSGFFYLPCSLFNALFTHGVTL